MISLVSTALAAGTFTLSSLPMCPQNENCEDAVEKLARELQHEVRRMLRFLVKMTLIYIASTLI